jgi:hypothetical protein
MTISRRAKSDDFRIVFGYGYFVLIGGATTRFDSPELIWKGAGRPDIAKNFVDGLLRRLVPVVNP